MQLRSIIRRRRSVSEAMAEAAVANVADAAVPATNCPGTWDPLPNPGQEPMTDPKLEPRDEAVALLHATAEVEHSLMVQYLYAAYSIADPADDDPDRDAKQKKVDLLRYLLLHIAREEMAHLASVQNLLHLLGAPLHLDREHSPFASELLPFRFKLEPVSLGSLAKYLIAESPRPLPDDGSISDADKAMIMGTVTDQAKASNDGICPSHVGDIFARLLWLFRHGEADCGLSDTDFRSDTQEFQASWDDWGFAPKTRTKDGIEVKAGESLVKQFAGSDPANLRSRAVAALEAIADQGEGADAATSNPSDDEESHFEWFLQAYKTFKELTELPGPIPVHNVPVCPNTSDATVSSAPYHKMVDSGLESFVESGRITNTRSRRWAKLFNLRYRILLTQLHHYLRIDTPRYEADGDRTARGYLLIGVFHEMRRLKKIAKLLVTLPKGDESDPHRAGPPFELPYTTQIPDGEKNRWRMHLDTSKAAVRLIDQMLAESPDQGNGFLIDVKAADEKDHEFMAELVAGRPLPPQSQDFPKVVQILEEAVRGFTIGRPHGNFWEESDLAAFKAKQNNWVIGNDPSGSRILKVLRGTDPLGQMPRERPAVPQSRIDYIEGWITRNCPDSDPPYPGLQRERDPIPTGNGATPPVNPPVTPPSQAPSFATNIRPLFTPSDIACMKAIRDFDLSDYNDVKARAASIFQQLDEGLMPPQGRWPQADIDLFKAWMDGGFPT